MVFMSIYDISSLPFVLLIGAPFKVEISFHY